MESHYDDLQPQFEKAIHNGFPFMSATSPALDGHLTYCLEWLIKTLYAKHKQRVIVLVDEYDGSLHSAFEHNYYAKASKVLGRLYSNALKGNTALKKACLMGIVEVRGAGLLSNLNNLCVYSVADSMYAPYFGFTKAEVCQFVGGNFESSAECTELMEWYNGYTMGKERMINPWSFISWLELRQFAPYWVATSQVKTLKILVQPHLQLMREKLFELLYFDSGCHSDIRLVTAIDFSALVSPCDAEDVTVDNVLHFLVLLGYLSYSFNDDGAHYRIPNKEVKTSWQADIIPLLKEEIRPVADELGTALHNSDMAQLQQCMRTLLPLYCSFHDLLTENSYHTYFLGCFSVLDYKSAVIVSSNREAGNGRYDVCIKFTSTKKVYLFEFKKSDKEGNLARDAQVALDQIKARQYYAEFKGYTCVLIGVAFFKKFISDLVWEEMTV